MWHELKQHIDIAHTRLKNMFARGQLNSVSNGGTAKAQVQLMADEVNDGLEFPQDYGIISNPPAGSQVIALFLGGDRSHGSILKMFHPSYAPNNLASGEVALYHMSGTIIHLKADGSVEMTSTTGMKITTPTLELDGNLSVSGDIIDQTSGGNSHSISSMRGLYNSHVHTSPGTNTPTPSQ